MKKIIYFVIILAAIVGCDNKATGVVGSTGTENVEIASEKSNRDKIIDLMKEAKVEYTNAQSKEELDQIEARLKKEVNAIIGNCTVNEIKALDKDEEYNKLWKECMQALDKTITRLGIEL